MNTGLKLTTVFFIVMATLQTQTAIHAQTPVDYDFALQVKGANPESQTVHFGYWYTGTPYLIDSATVDSLRPTARFKGKKTIEPGLYFFNIKGSATPLEFVVNNEYNLEFSTYASAPLDSFNVAQSVENEPYFNWRTYRHDGEQRIANMRSMLEMLQRATRDRETLEEQANKIRELRQEIDNNTRKQPIKYPNLFFAKMVNAEAPPEVPPSIEPLTPEGRANPEYIQYFRQHFWDNYDFSDARMLRTPTLARKCDDWLQIQTNTIDSVKISLDQTLAKANLLSESRHAITRLLLERFDKPSYGGNETMMTYLFDKHMPTATYAGLDTASWIRIQYKTDSYRPTLPGTIAPEINLADTAGTSISLHGFLAKYTLLYFFSPLCSHCQKITPTVYEQTLPYAEKGIKVFAVTSDGQMDVWKKYVANSIPNWTCVADPAVPSLIEKAYGTHGLPNLLLLDENKKVLIRRLPLEELPNLLKNIGR